MNAKQILKLGIVTGLISLIAGTVSGPVLSDNTYLPAVEISETEFNYVPYQYQAEVVSVYDADTITVEVDLGFHVKVTEKLRLYGINAWEVRGEERPKGLIARDWLREKIPIGSTVYIQTVKDKTGKYGRFIATIYIKYENGWVNLNENLVLYGHAKEASY